MARSVSYRPSACTTARARFEIENAYVSEENICSVENVGMLILGELWNMLEESVVRQLKTMQRVSGSMKTRR